MQRRGRRGLASYRVIVQDSRRTPSSGKVVARLGYYDPHSKTNNLDKEKAQYYLDHGAQPTERVVALFKSEKIKLPNWVKEPSKKERSIKNPEKLRKNRPTEEKIEEPKAETPADEASEAPAETDAKAGDDSDASDKKEEASEETEAKE